MTNAWLKAIAVLAFAIPARAQEGTPPPSPADTPVTTEEPPLSTTPAASTVELLVLAKGSGVPLSKVEIKTSVSSVFTGPDGKVVFPVPGDAVGISRKGFEREQIPATFWNGPGSYEIFLYPAVTNDEIIVIRGSRKPAISKKTISIEEARKVAPGGDPGQIVKLLPGVQTSNFGGEAIIRGSGPSNSMYFIDDVEVPGVYHAIGNLTVIPGSLLASVDFESGGFGPEYGDATGGVIVLRTLTEVPERPKTEFVLNLPFYSGIYHIRPLDEKSYVAVGARRSYIDLFIQGFLNQAAKKDKAPPIVVTPFFTDAQFVYFKKDENGHHKWSLLGAGDGITAKVPAQEGFGEDGNLNFDTFMGFANLSYERLYRLDRDWRVVTTPQIYHLIQDFAFLDNSVNMKITRLRAPTEWTKRLSAKEDFYVGIDPGVTTADVEVDSIQPRFDDPTFDIDDAPKRKIKLSENIQSHAAWVSRDFQMGSWIVSPGARAFYNSQIDKTSADPRLRARWEINEQHTLKTAAGQYSESPSPEEASTDWGNPDLDFTRSYHYILGLETKWDEAWATEVQVFHKTIHDIVRSDTATNYANKADGRSSGFEFFVRRNLTTRLFGWLSYTYSKTEERGAKGESYREANYDQTHVVNAVGNYKLTGTWELGGRFNYHTGDVYDKVSDSIYNADTDKYEQRPTDGDKNAGRLPDTKSLTIYAQHDFLFDYWKLALRFGLESFWLQPQVASYRYNYDYTEEEAVQGLSSIPFLELRGEI